MYTHAHNLKGISRSGICRYRRAVGFAYPYRYTFLHRKRPVCCAIYTVLSTWLCRCCCCTVYRHKNASAGSSSSPVLQQLDASFFRPRVAASPLIIRRIYRFTGNFENFRGAACCTRCFVYRTLPVSYRTGFLNFSVLRRGSFWKNDI